MKTIFFILLALLFMQMSAQGSESERVISGKVTAQLVTDYDRAQPNSDIYIALSLRLEKHWHTYWRNAGGPGVPAELYWTLPQGIEVGEIVWPLPKIVHTGPIVNYAFEDRLLLPMSLHIPKSARVGDVITIDAEASYLVCYEVCLPESAKLSVDIKIGEPVKDARWMANIKRALKAAPKPDQNFKAAARLQNESVFLDIQSKDLRAGQYKNPYFFPYVQDIIDADAPQVMQIFNGGFRLVLTPGWKLKDTLSQDIVGVMSYEEKKGSTWAQRNVIVTASAHNRLDMGEPISHTPRQKQKRSIVILFGLMGLLFGAGGIALLLRRRAQKP